MRARLVSTWIVRWAPTELRVRISQTDLWQTDQPTPSQVGTLLLYDTQLPRPPGITDPMAVAGYAAG